MRVVNVSANRPGQDLDLYGKYVGREARLAEYPERKFLTTVAPGATSVTHCRQAGILVS